MKVRVPASSANLGPGFDTLALALSLYITVEVRPASTLSINCSGFGAELEKNHGHLAAKVVRDVLGHDEVDIEIESEIPLARGLGSSAALAVAVAASAGAYDAFVVGAEFDGHGENAGASYLGGLVAAGRLGDTYEATSLPLDPRVSSIVIVPEQKLSTSDARSVLPELIPRSDVVFNLQRLTFLLAGLADLDQLKSEFGQERIHELPRETLFPAAKLLKELLLDSGALVATWSGAGTSVIGIFERDEAIAKLQTVRNAVSELQIDATAMHLQVDTVGLDVVDGDPYSDLAGSDA